MYNAIFTEYMSASSTKSSRIKAANRDFTHEYPLEELSGRTTAEINADAAKKFCERHGFHGQYIQAGSLTGYCFVKVELPNLPAFEVGPPPAGSEHLTFRQRIALADICQRYNVTFRYDDYRSCVSLPSEWVSGWVGGQSAGKIFVGVSPEGEINS